MLKTEAELKKAKKEKTENEIRLRQAGRDLVKLTEEKIQLTEELRDLKKLQNARNQCLQLAARDEKGRVIVNTIDKLINIQSGFSASYRGKLAGDKGNLYTNNHMHMYNVTI